MSHDDLFTHIKSLRKVNNNNIIYKNKIYSLKFSKDDQSIMLDITSLPLTPEHGQILVMEKLKFRIC
jgi:hypothetical protein